MTNPDIHGGAGGQELLVAPDLSFAYPDSVHLLRISQESQMDEAAAQAIAGIDSPMEAFQNGGNIWKTAREEKAREFDGQLRAHVESHTEDLPEEMRGRLNNRLVSIISKYSADKMDAEEWGEGKEGADGERQPSGWQRLQEEIDELRTELENPDEDEEDDDEDDNPPPLPEITREQTERVKNARNNLAELSYKRRQLIRKGGKKARELETQYNRAKAEYDAAYKEVGVISAQRLRAQGADDPTLRAAVVRGLLNEHQAFSDAELQVMENDSSARARVARWLARRHNLTVANVASGVVIGGASKYLIGGLIGAGAGILAPAAIGAGAAIKSTKAVMAGTVGNRANNIRRFDQRFDQDHEELETHLTEHAHGHSGNDTALIHGAHDHVIGVIDRRVEKDRKSNRNRVIAAAAIGGAAGLVGEVLETVAVDTEHLFFGGGGHAPSTPSSPSGPSVPHPRGPSTPSGPSGPSSPHHVPGGNPNRIDGFNPNVQVSNGEGYEQALTDLASQKGIHLTAPQSWALYEHLNNSFNGHFFTNNPSFHMNNPGEWGISRPGASHWDPAVIAEMNSWLNQNDIHAQAMKKVAKKAGKVVAGRATQAAFATAA